MPKFESLYGTELTREELENTPTAGPSLSPSLKFPRPTPVDPLKRTRAERPLTAEDRLAAESERLLKEFPNKNVSEETAFRAKQFLEASEPREKLTTDRARMQYDILDASYRSYVEKNRAQNLPHFPTETAKLNAKRNQQFANLYTKDPADYLDEDQLKEYQFKKSRSTDPEAYHARAANRAYLEGVNGAPIADDKYDFARDQFARQNFGLEEDTSDKALFQAIKSRHEAHDQAGVIVKQKGNELYRQGLEGATRKDLESMSFQKQAKNAGVPEEHITRSGVQLESAFRQGQIDRRDAMPIVKGIVQGFALRRGRDIKQDQSTATGEEIFTSVGQAVRELAKYNPDKRSRILHLVSKEIERLPEISDEQSLLKKAFFALADGTRGYADRLLKFEDMLSQTAFNILPDGIEVLPGVGGMGNPKFKKGLDDRVQLRSALSGQMGSLPMWNPTEGFFDNPLEKGVVGFSSQLPNLVSVFAGIPGLTTLSASMAGESYGRQRLETPEGNQLMQAGFGTGSGILQAGTEVFLTKAGLKLIGGRIPGLAKVFNSAGIKSPALRSIIAAPLGAAGATAVEYTEEMVQEATDNLLTDIARELSGFDSTTDWGEFLKSWTSRNRKTEEVIFSILPFALIGSGAVTSFRHFKHGEFLQNATPIMKGLGMKPDVIREIQEASPTEAAKLVQGEVKRVGERSKAEEASKPASELAEEGQQRAAVLDSVREAANLARTINYGLLTEEENEFTGEDQWVLRLPDQAEQIFETEEAAVEAHQSWAIDEHQDNLELITNAGILNTIEFLTEEGQLAYGTRVVKKDVDMTPERAISQGLASMELMKARANIFALQEGTNGNPVDLQIMARRFAEVSTRGVYRGTVEYYRKADGLNVFEDLTETNWHKAITLGFYDGAELLQHLRQVEQLTKQKYISADYEYSEDNQLDLLEGLSKLSVEYALGHVNADNFPAKLKRWLEYMVALAGQMFRHAKTLARSKNLMDKIKEGKIDEKFLSQVADSVGLNDAETRHRREQLQAAEAHAQALGDFEEISSSLRGRIPHPQTLLENSDPLHGEVARIHDSMKKITRRKNKKGQGVVNSVMADNYFLPLKEGKDVKLDEVRRSLNEDGYNFETPAEMIEALVDSLLYGIQTHATGNLDEAAFQEGSFSISPAQDAEYMAAVESGDMETAQGMVMDQMLKNPRTLPSDLEEAWKIGSSVSDLSDVEDVYSGKVPEWVFNFGNDVSQFFAAGKRGEKPTYIVGNRRGEIPTGGRSFNHADGTAEPGVSMAYVHNRGDNETNALTMNGVSSRDLTFLDGWTFPDELWGSDGELVALSAKEFNPVTRDDAGNVIPLSQRFDQSSDQSSFSLSPSQDADYMAAVESGDTDTAQRMVDEAAKKAGYDSPKVYHGSNTGNIMAFEQGRAGGIYFTENQQYAAGYGTNEYSAYLKTGKIADLRRGDSPAFKKMVKLFNENGGWSQNVDAMESRDSPDFNPATDFTWEIFDNPDTDVWFDLSKDGYDSVILEEETGIDSYVVFDPNQIKSADPVTRDDAGNVIPLSQRFDEMSDQISFSLSPAQDAEGYNTFLGDVSNAIQEWSDINQAYQSAETEFEMQESVGFELQQKGVDFDTEEGQMQLDEAIAAIDYDSTKEALLDALDDAKDKTKDGVQEALEGFLEPMGYEIYSPNTGGSFYFYISPNFETEEWLNENLPAFDIEDARAKIRFSDHANTSSLHSAPDVNIQPGESIEPQFNSLFERLPNLTAIIGTDQSSDQISFSVDYRGTHSAPLGDYGGPGHNLSDFFPDDIYGPNGARYYGHSRPGDQEAINVIRSMRDKPNAAVKVYRAIPGGIESKINPGDWVTTVEAYAKEHGEAALQGNYQVVSKTVKAKEIFTEGNSIYEWGYDPTGNASFSMSGMAEDSNPIKDRKGEDQGKPLTETEIREQIEDEPGTLADIKIDDDLFSQDGDDSFSVASNVPIIKRSSLKGKKKFVYFSDWTRVGVYTGLHAGSGIAIDLQGGPSFPYIDGHKKKGKAGWAFTTEGMFTRFQSRVNQTDGIGLTTLYGKDNLRANPTFLKAYVEELKYAVKAKLISKAKMLEALNKARVQVLGLSSKRKNQKTGEVKVVYTVSRDGKTHKDFSKDWTSIAQFNRAMKGATFEVRAAMFSTSPKVITRNKVKKKVPGEFSGGRLASQTSVKAGMPDVIEMINLFADPMFDGAEYGTIVGAIQFEKGQTSSVKAQDIGAEEHLSYPVVIKGKGLGLFDSFIHANKVVANPQKKSGFQLTRSSETSMAPASFSLSSPGVERLEAAVLAKLNKGPEERIDYASKLIDRLHGLRQKGSQENNKGDLERITENLNEAGAIFTALPVEVRAKASFPMKAIAEAKTEKAKLTLFEKMIDSADKALEGYLQKEYLESLTKLFDLAKPDLRQNKSLRTRLSPNAQRLATAAFEVSVMSPEEVINGLQSIETTINNFTSLRDQAAIDGDKETIKKHSDTLHDAERYQRMLNTFGALAFQSSYELAEALDNLRHIYAQGKFERDIIDDRRRQDLDGMRESVLPDLGGRPASDEWQRNTAKEGFFSRMGAFAMGSLSFHQIMEKFFPTSDAARQFQKRIRTADRDVTRARINARERFEAHLRERWGKGKLGQAKILAELSKRVELPNKIREWKNTEEVAIDPELAKKILDGTTTISWSDDPIALQSLRQALADFNLKRLRDQSRAELVRFKRVISRAPARPLVISPLETVYILQLAGQEQYLPALDRYGYTEGVIDALRQGLPDEARDIADFLANEYAGEYDRLNPVYRTLFHMDMPRVKNYAPGSFEHMFHTTTPDPDGTEAAPVNALSAGFTKARQHHIARPQQRNALEVFWNHHEQTEYFIAWAEVSRDMGAVFKTPDVRRALESKYGKKVATNFFNWIDGLATDFRKPTNEEQSMREFVNNAQASLSAIGLAVNVGSLLKQFSAGTGAMLEMPTSKAVAGMYRAITNPSSFKDLWETDTIQQRIKQGMSPEDRAILEASNAKPSTIMALLEAGRAPLGLVDGIFTTLSAMIAYNYHLAEAKKAGLSPEKAEAHALEVMDRVIVRTAQPATAQDKSLIENTSKGFTKFLLIFRSDPRQKMALAMEAVDQFSKGKMGKLEFARRFFWGWGVYGILAQIATDLWHAISREEDEELSLDDYIYAGIAGPITGLPLFGSIVDTGIRNAINALGGDLQIFTNSTNPLDKAAFDMFRGRTLKKLTDDEDDTAGEIMKAILSDSRAWAQVLGVFAKATAIVPVTARAVRDTYGMIENALPDSPEDEQGRILDQFLEESKEASDEASDRKEILLEELQGMDESAQKDRLQELDKTLARSLMKSLSDATLTKNEKKLRRIPTKERHKAIQAILKTLAPADRGAYLQRLREVKILTGKIERMMQ